MKNRPAVTLVLLGAVVSSGCGSDNKSCSPGAICGTNGSPDAVSAMGRDAAQEDDWRSDAGAGDAGAALPGQDGGGPDLLRLDGGVSDTESASQPDVGESDAGAGAGPEAGATDAPLLKDVSNLRAQAGNAGVVLTWTDPTLVDVVAVEITWSPGGTTPVAVSRGAQLATVGPLQNGTSYTFTVRTVDAAGTRSSGVSVSATPSAAAPTEVTGLTAHVSGQGVTLTWTNPSDGSFDHVQVTCSPGSASPAIVAPLTQTKVYSSLPDGAVYTFLVQTADTGGHLSTGVSVQAAVDISAPSAGGGVTFSNTLATSVTVSWGEASDNLTPAALLDYTLLRSASGADMSTVAAAEANGTVVGEGVDLRTALATGLAEATTYQFVVVVKDALGNQSLYPPATMTTLETTAPTPGTSISFAKVTAYSAQVSWGAATDAVTAANALEYKLVRAAVTADIDTVAEADAVTGTNLVMDWTANTTTSAAAGLSEYTQYFFAVLVRNAAGVKALYAPVPVVTTGWSVNADSTPPVPGNSGTIDIAGIQGTHLWLRWTGATDNVTAKSDLRYKVVSSTSNNLDDTSTAESNGTAAMGWASVADLSWQGTTGSERTAVVVSDLTEATSYYFNVIVKDAAGNKAVYTAKAATTGYDMAFTKVYGSNQDGTQPSPCPLTSVRGLTSYGTSVYLTQATQPQASCGNPSNDGQLGYIDISGGVPAGITWKTLSSTEGISSPRLLEVSADGNTLYVGSGAGISAYDITTKSTPTHHSHVSLDGVTSMTRWADRLYLARSTTDLSGMSSHNLSSGLSATPEALWDCGFANSNVRGLSVIGDGTGIQLTVGSLGASLDAAGQGIYGLAIDNATPTTASLVWSDTSNGYSMVGASLSGTYVWAASPTGSELTAFDRSTPASTAARWNAPDPNNAAWGDMLVDGRFAYVSNVENGITVFDISQPDFPVPVYSRDTHNDGDQSSDAYTVRRSGEYLYVAANSYFLAYKLHNVDALAPTPGNSGAISTSVVGTEVDLSWTAASDSATAPIAPTAQNSLEYRAYSGPTAVDFSSVRNVLEYGTAQSGWTQAMTSRAVTGLTEGTPYRFAVLVRDGWGNIGLYVAASATTDAAPVASLPTSVTVSGAGNPSVDGTYVPNGTHDGRPSYRNGGYYIYYCRDAQAWIINFGLDDNSLGHSDYGNDSISSTVPQSGWTTLSGSDPAPTLSGGATISGAPFVNSSLTASYNYSDTEGDPEGATKVQWYRCGTANDPLTACTLVLDTTKPTLTYSVVSADAGKYLKVKITPIATSGTPTGAAITSEACQIRRWDSVKLFSESGSFPRVGAGIGGTIAVGYDTSAGAIGVEYYDTSSWQMLPSPGNADSSSLQVRMDATGKPVVLSADPADSGKAKVFAWNGSAWSSLGYSASNARFAQMVMGSSPIVQVSAGDMFGDLNHVYKWNDSGTAWTDLGNPSNGTLFSSEGGGSLALLSNGTLVSAFIGRQPTDELDVATSTGDGSWTPLASPLGTSVQFSDLVVDGSDQIYIAAQDDDATIEVLKYNTSSKTWESLGSPGYSFYPRMGITQDGHLFVVFLDTEDLQQLRISIWTGGTTWTTPDLIGVTGRMTMNFDVATTGNSTIYVAFADGDQSKLHLLKYNGTLP